MENKELVDEIFKASLKHFLQSSKSEIAERIRKMSLTKEYQDYIKNANEIRSKSLKENYKEIDK